MKKACFYLLSILVILLLLAGCDKTKADDSPTEPPPTGSAGPPPSGDAPGGTAGTPLPADDLDAPAYYSRDTVIGRGETVQGDFIDTSTWAEQYARDMFEIAWDAEVTSAFQSGFTTPEGFFAEGYTGGSVLWDVTVSKDHLTGQTFTVQVVYVRDSYRTLFLSGILSGEGLMLSRPEVYVYLKDDSRFSHLIQEFPELPAEDNLEILELSALHHNMPVYDACLLSDTLLAVVFVTNSDYYNAAYAVYFYDLSSRRVVFSREFEGEGFFSSISVENGRCVLMFGHSFEQDQYTKFEITPSGATKTSHLDMAAETAHAMPGGLTVIERNNSLYLLDTIGNERLLFTGVDTDDENVLRYVYYDTIDSTRFIYYESGWEWSGACSIFHAETGVSTPVLATGEQSASRHPVLYAENELITNSDYFNLDFAVTDLRTEETRLLAFDRLDLTDIYDFYYAFSSDGAKFVVVIPDFENDQPVQVLVFDRTNSAVYPEIESVPLLYTQEISPQLGYIQSVHLANNGTVDLVLHRYETDADILLQIRPPA